MTTLSLRRLSHKNRQLCALLSEHSWYSSRKHLFSSSRHPLPVLPSPSNFSSSSLLRTSPFLKRAVIRFHNPSSFTKWADTTTSPFLTPLNPSSSLWTLLIFYQYRPCFRHIGLLLQTRQPASSSEHAQLPLTAA
ncbi:hypothetical protein NPIL_272551 [Nephila pilipes]|uniref:Uncharacterized protein n=1 Tax=Nephila pilipes TaxID=299642 RepID=A0A8X6Q1M5_NEPPI|nr:hypothetical protein NPIL_272551 [Nephila pilipes]